MRAESRGDGALRRTSVRVHGWPVKEVVLWPQHLSISREKGRGTSQVPPERLTPPPRGDWGPPGTPLLNARPARPARSPSTSRPGASPPSAGSPPPLLRAASSEALCWSKTSKNEASGPTGAKAMAADSDRKRQAQEPHQRPRRPSLVLAAHAPWRRVPLVGLLAGTAHAHCLGRRITTLACA